MNHSDSERIASALERVGFTETENLDESDLLVANTCSVRQKSEDKILGFLRNFKKMRPEAVVALTGCMVRETGSRATSRDACLRFSTVDFVFRTEDATKIPEILREFFPDFEISDGGCGEYFEIEPKISNKVQVFVPIMTGCDKFCSYCIVPYARGREVSREIDEVFAECEKHVRAGAREISLLGQNVNSYAPGFGKLLKKIDSLADLGLNRIRLISPHPQDLTDEQIEILAEMRTFPPYLHLPAQHGSDRILKKMNRRYTAEDFEKLVAKLRAAIPGIAIATDIIVGFPGESEEDFRELCDFARRVKFDFSYTAIYSPRSGTPAAEMESDFVPMAEKKRRFAEFDAIIAENAMSRRGEWVGKTVEVLVERAEQIDGGLWRNGGRSREYFEVWFEAGRDFSGKIVEVEVVGRKGYVLRGMAVEGR